MSISKHFVEFFSPGTFVSESTRKEVDSWDVQAALAMAGGIKERHAAIPYGFQFCTRTRGETDLDSKESKRSPMYFLGGSVMTLEQVKARNDPADRILISNMEGNGYKRIIVNTNSWRTTLPLGDDDVVLPWSKP